MIHGSTIIMVTVLTTGAAACGAGTILGATAIMPAGMILGLTLGTIHGIMAMLVGMVAGTAHGIMAGVDITIHGIGAVRYTDMLVMAALVDSTLMEQTLDLHIVIMVWALLQEVIIG